MTEPASEPRMRLAPAVAAVVSVLALGCQAAPPPGTNPGRAPTPSTAPTNPVRPAPRPILSCTPGPSAGDGDTADFEALEGLELDLTAFGAALNALSGNGTVDITTEEEGRPEFATVGVHQLNRTLRSETDPVLAVEASSVVSAAEVAGTGDPLHAQQWSDTVTPYTPTWSCGRGSGVDIAVVDTGVDRTHPDLSGHTTTGGASLNGAASVTPGAGGVDPHGHGTHVAGIAAATAGNGVGISGVAPGATIIPVRVLGPSGAGWSSDVAAGITWATDAGAEVINLSLGTPSSSQAMSSAITYARANGVIVVAAAGNDGASGPRNYPAAENQAVAVGSIDPSGGISAFSTHGSYVDVAAPGSVILSTVPGAAYANKSGTSMATPFVSGVAALLISAKGALEPGVLADLLTSTADDAGPPGVDPAFGHGIINPVRALTG